MKVFVWAVALVFIVVDGYGAGLQQSAVCTEPGVASLVQPQPVNIEGATSYTYKSVSGAVLRLHVFEPKGARSRKLPAIVLFFGGGWLWGNVADVVPQAQYFSDRGMVAIAADYRVFCRHQSDITQEMADARSAIRWVRLHAKDLGIAPNRIAAGGSFSGAHLALTTAGFDDLDTFAENTTVSSRPDALVLYHPSVDETSAEEKKNSAGALGNHGRDVSPAYHISSNLPSMLILEGTADPLYSTVEKYCSKVRSSGGYCEFSKYDGALPDGGKWSRDVLQDADRFLTKEGFLARRDR
jgi:acetyl esterase/lipase